eukprot:5630806-Amphidinium_carterae.1
MQIPLSKWAIMLKDLVAWEIKTLRMTHGMHEYFFEALLMQSAVRGFWFASLQMGHVQHTETLLSCFTSIDADCALLTAECYSP